MKRTILILSALFLSISHANGQIKKNTKPMPDIDFKTVKEDACGVKKSLNQTLDEVELEWRSVGPGTKSSYFYNTRKLECDAKTKTIKVWVKEIREPSQAKASMARYELNCRTEQLRLLTMVEYYENGEVSETFAPATPPKWQDVTPETIGSAIFIVACRKY